MVVADEFSILSELSLVRVLSFDGLFCGSRGLMVKELEVSSFIEEEGGVSKLDEAMNPTN